MFRGFLIRWFYVDIARLDTLATAADPDAGGPLTSGYDDDFREPEIVPPSDPDSDERGTIVREESVVRLRAQLEDDRFEEDRMLSTGRSPISKLVVIIHYDELEREGLIDSNTGDPLLRLNDRLDSVYNKYGDLVQRVRNPPGLFCTECQPRFGAALGFHRNLLRMVFEQRDTSVSQ